MYSGPGDPDTARVASPAETTVPRTSPFPRSTCGWSPGAQRSPSRSPWRPPPSCSSPAAAFGVFADALSRALSADPRWIAVAAVAELLSFAGYIALFWLVGRRATPRLDLRAGAEITLGGAAATRLLPTAGVGGAALTLWAIAKTGIGSKRAGRTLLTFLSLLYGVFLAGIAISGAAIALGAGGSHRPRAARRRRGAGRRRGDRGRARARPPATARPATAPAGSRAAPRCSAARCATRSASCAAATPACSARPPGGRSTPPCCGPTFHALGAPPSLAVLAFAYFAGQVGNTIPMPGAVSGGMVGTLLAFGVAPGPRALLGARLPRGRDLAAGAARPRRPRPPCGRASAAGPREDDDAAELVETIVAPAFVAPAIVTPSRPVGRPALVAPCACAGSA